MYNFIKEIFGELIEVACVDGVGYVWIFFWIMLLLFMLVLVLFGIF